MAKDWERKEAYKFYVKEGKNAKECARLLKVSEKTVGKWVDGGNWKERRSAHISSVKSGEENINDLINMYTENAIELETSKNDLEGLDEKGRKERLMEIAKEKVALVDAIAKLNKTKEGFEKDNKIPFHIYAKVSEQIMAAALDHFPEKKHPEMLDFFEEHINNIAINYK